MVRIVPCKVAVGQELSKAVATGEAEGLVVAHCFRKCVRGIEHCCQQAIYNGERSYKLFFFVLSFSRQN
jgi:methyl coenzyme M reductase subunit D